MIRLHSSGPGDTRECAAAVAALARAGDVLLLSGDLGAGKTTFAQGFAAGLGVDGPVTSPTFTLVNEYDGRLRLLHADVYRLETLQEVIDLGIGELVEDDSVALIEWGEAAAPALPSAHLTVRIEFTGDDEAREISIVSEGDGWERRREALAEAVDRWRKA